MQTDLLSGNEAVFSLSLPFKSVEHYSVSRLKSHNWSNQLIILVRQNQIWYLWYFLVSVNNDIEAVPWSSSAPYSLLLQLAIPMYHRCTPAWWRAAVFPFYFFKRAVFFVPIKSFLTLMICASRLSLTHLLNNYTLMSRYASFRWIDCFFLPFCAGGERRPRNYWRSRYKLWMDTCHEPLPFVLIENV